MRALKRTTVNPELADRFNRVLGETVEAMDESKIRYAFIGGIASGGLGRPRSTHDIDIFVMPEDAELVLRALSKHGFSTEKTDPSWLFKAFKSDILVDVIFKSKGEIYLDNEMFGRMITAEFHGKRLKLVAPEDLFIIKAAAHSELTPGHWHDALALLTHSNLDWEYLLRRARRAPRRVLSLLLYAQSNDIWVPNHVVLRLFANIFGELADTGAVEPSNVHDSHRDFSRVQAKANPTTGLRAPTREHPAYILPHLREALAQDPRTHELDIQIEQDGYKIVLQGEVTHQERRVAVENLAKEFCPGCVIENHIEILPCTEPGEPEEISRGD